MPEDGLAAYGDTGDDLMMALARKLVSGETDDGEVEDLFARAQQVAAEAEQLLVDAGWERSHPGLVSPIAVLPSGGEETLVDLVPCATHHSQEQLQQTLFSWAEFMAEEPEQPGSRKRSLRPAGPSPV